jgi:hypothetical protein
LRLCGALYKKLTWALLLLRERFGSGRSYNAFKTQTNRIPIEALKVFYALPLHALRLRTAFFTWSRANGSIGFYEVYILHKACSYHKML